MRTKSLTWVMMTLLVGLIAVGQSVACGDEPDAKAIKVTALVREAGTERPIPRFTIAIAETKGPFKSGLFVSDESGQITLERLANADPEEVPECFAVPFHDERWKMSRTSADAGDWRDLKFLRRTGTSVTAAWEQRGRQQVLVIDVTPTGEWEAVVRGPEGMPLADTEVNVVAQATFRVSFDDNTILFRGRTDSMGRIRLRWGAEQRKFVVQIPGLGMTLSAPVKVVANKTVTASLPWLVRYGRITGSVHSDAAQPGDTIQVDDYGWDRRSAIIQEDGQFELNDVVPGVWALKVLGRQPRATFERVLPLDVSVGPGQHVRGVQCERIAALPEAPPALPAREPVKPKEPANQKEPVNQGSRSGGLIPIPPFGDDSPPRPLKQADGLGNAKPFVTGRVTDPAGQPLEGVRVIVTSQYFGGLRMYESTSESQTEKDGTYRVNWVRLGTGPVAVLAIAKGRPPTSVRGTAVGLPGSDRSVSISMGAGLQTVPTLASADKDEKGVLEPHVRADIVIPDRGGTMAVRVFDKGQPAERGFVRLTLNDWHQQMGFGWAREESRDGRASRDQAWQFTEPIGKEGIARFEHLPSGEYTAVAVVGTLQDLAAHSDSQAPFGDNAATGRRHTGVFVVDGEERQVTMQVSPMKSVARVRILKPDGSELTSKTVGIQYSNMGRTVAWNTSRETTPDGTMLFGFGAHGLWRFELTAHDASVRQIPVKDPTYSASAIIGVSSLYPELVTRDIHLTRVGSVSVVNDATAEAATYPEATIRLLDRDGKPARGAVAVRTNGSRGTLVALGASNDRGEFRFSGFSINESLMVSVCLNDRPPLPALSLSTSDDDLLGASGWRHQQTQFAHRAELVLSEEPRGFVRGEIQFPDGLRPEDYRWVKEPLGEECQTFYDLATGRFIAGPLKPGEHLIHWRHRGTADFIDAENASLISTIVVPGDAVTSVSLKLKPRLRRDLSLVRQQQWRQFAGSVVLSDGRTPAIGARLLQFASNSIQPVSGAWADARGRFATAGLIISGQGVDANPPGSPAGPILLAWVPGATAPQIVPLPTEQDQPRDLKIELPRGHRVRGQVTVAGKSALAVAAPITLRLQRRGHGKLDPYLSTEVTTDADGRFDLRGINPGEYTCQAMLDSLWLSPSIAVNITDDREDLRLNIPAPGGPARLRFVRADGTPLRQHRIKVDWHSGPLTERSHSEPLKTDGEGWLTLDGVAVGTARVQAAGEPAWHDISVAPLSNESPPPQVVTVELQPE